MGVENTGELAGKLWSSLQNAFAGLPDELPIYPAHGAGSPCGAGIEERDETPTLGLERSKNPALQYSEEKAFLEDLLWTQPPVPYYWPRMKEINARGPKILGGVPDPQILEPKDFKTAIKDESVQLLDTRHFFAFGGGHIAGAINIGYAPSISMWGGWLIDPAKPVALVVPNEGDAQEVARWLVRVGITRFTGVLVDGMDAWSLAAGQYETLGQMSVQAIQERLGNANYQLVDVRSPHDWDLGHIPGARYMYLPEIPKRARELDQSKPVVAYCGTGYRSSIAASLFKKEGFEAYGVPGSYKAWLAAGYEVKVPDSIGKASDTRRA